NNATLGRFFHDGGWGLSQDSMNLWSGTTSDGQSVGRADWSNGDKCPKGTQYAGKSGVVKWSIDCKSKSGNPADYKLHDLQVIALAFLPKSADIGVPPNASATPSADANSNPKALNVQSCSTAGPGGEVTTTTI